MKHEKMPRQSLAQFIPRTPRRTPTVQVMNTQHLLMHGECALTRTLRLRRVGALSFLEAKAAECLQCQSSNTASSKPTHGRLCNRHGAMACLTLFAPVQSHCPSSHTLETSHSHTAHKLCPDYSQGNSHCHCMVHGAANRVAGPTGFCVHNMQTQ
jgi:hypothetical protein